MRNLIIGISAVFIAIIVVSYFYFSGLSEKGVVMESSATTSEETKESEPAATENTSAGTESQRGDGSLWIFRLNSGPITAPSVHLYGDSSRFILVQDAYHILHAISADGEKLWNAQLPGPIVDSISQLPDRSLVFATADRLYRIDTEGDPLPGFSLKLPQRATQHVIATGQPGDEASVRIEVIGSRQIMSYGGRGKLLRSETRSSGDRANDENRLADNNALSNLPNNCSPLAYIGPLYNDDQQYLLCGRPDGGLYCFRF